MGNLTDKIALVTGASRGIGQGILQNLAQQGAYVVGTATSESGAAVITDFIHQQGFEGRGLALDLTDKAAIEEMISHLADEGKSPSILVNNAGITQDDLLLRMTDEDWYKVIETNLSGVFHVTRACLKSMVRNRWGRIISIGSVVGSSGNPGQSNYCAAKAGIIGFSKSLAQEVASRAITVNVVSPGFIDTDMTRGLPDMVKDELLKRIPMKRLGQAEDIAHAVAFLASQYANYITGQTIHVNGGMYMD